METRDYNNLLEKLGELVYYVDSVGQYSNDNSYAQEKYKEELENKIKELQENLSTLEEILTIDCETFNELFMRELNDPNYELVHIKLGENVIHVAKPKNLVLDGGEKLLNEDVYILGVNDTKVLSKPAYNMEQGKLPVISLMSKPYRNIYYTDFTRHNLKYKKFDGFMDGVSNSLIKKYKLKKGKKK